MSIDHVAESPGLPVAGTAAQPRPAAVDGAGGGPAVVGPEVAPPVPTAPAPPPAPEPRSLGELAEALRRVNLTFDLFEIEARINVSDSGQVVVRIVNQRTGELIRQIPPEETRQFVAALEEGKGALTDLLA